MFTIGESTITKIQEMDLNGMRLDQLMPALDMDEVRRHPDWLPPGTADEGGHALLSIHSWLVRHNGHTILIDTGAGNGKARPQQPILENLDNPFLERLREASVDRHDVDTVVHTHIHSDHVGWNTMHVDGQWRPTFPNATVICSDLEWRYGAALTDDDATRIAAVREEAGLGEPVRVPVSGTFADSMRPVDDAGLVRRVPTDGTEILPGLRYLRTPGHSIDHAAIELTSKGQTAIFGGDVVHHPLEIYDPELVSMFCEFPEAARRSRAVVFERSIETNAVYFSAHFPQSGAGYVTRTKSGYGWIFEG